MSTGDGFQNFEKELNRLVEKFGRNLTELKSTGYDEAKLRLEYLDPFFKALGYFTTNPPHENAPLNVTAARANTVGEAFSSARSEVNDGNNTVKAFNNERKAKVATLRKRMSGLIAELGQLLADDDPQWASFGLRMPGAPSLPEVPDAPTLTAGAAGVVIASWDAAVRAENYRVWKQVVGTDVDFVFVDNPHDTGATITGLPTGATVKVCVSAVNDGGESAKSAAAQRVVP